MPAKRRAEQPVLPIDSARKVCSGWPSLWPHPGPTAPTPMSPSATKIAARLVADLEAVTSIESHPPRAVAEVIEQIEEPTERAQGRGAYATVKSVTLNIGTIHGGLKVNMTPGECGRSRHQAAGGRDQGRRNGEGERRPRWLHPGGHLRSWNLATMKRARATRTARWPQILRANVKSLKGFEPSPILSIGADLMRGSGVGTASPATSTAPPRRTWHRLDEYVEIDEFLHTVRSHVLSAYDYLTLPFEQ